MTMQDNGAVLTLFLIFLLLAFLTLIAAWAVGRRWGDLSSRRHYGEALTQEEQRALKRSRRSFWIWAGISLICAALSFFTLRE